MAKPSGSHAEYIAWTAVITAVVTVCVERIINHTATAGQRLTSPGKQIAPKGGYQ